MRSFIVSAGLLFALVVPPAVLRAQDCNHKCAADLRDEQGCCPDVKPKPRPRPKPRPAASAPASSPQSAAAPALAYLLLLPDADCEIFIDGASIGRVARDELKRVEVKVGDRTVIAASDDGRTVRSSVAAEGGGQFAVNLEFPPPAGVAPAASAPAAAAPPTAAAEAVENLASRALSADELRRIPIELSEATPVQGISAMRMADRRGQLPGELRRSLGAALRETGFEVTATPSRTPLKLRILAVPAFEGVRWTMSRIEVAVEYDGRLVDRVASVTPMDGAFGLFSFYNDSAARFCKSAADEVAAGLVRSPRVKKLLIGAAP